MDMMDMMDMTALDTGFGVEVNNIDLATLKDDSANTALLRAALLEHGLLVVRGQSLTPRQQVAASELFGPLEVFPPTASQVPGLPQIFRVASRPADGHVEVGRYWHSDGSFRSVPTPISIWQSVVEPEEGGATLFTDLRAAWATLPASLKDEVAHLQSMHRNGVLHPLAMTHPHTGGTSLYLNVGLTAAIVGYPAAQARALIERIDAHLSRDGASYTHQWRAGDVVVADNLRVAHRATAIEAAPRSGPVHRRRWHCPAFLDMIKNKALGPVFYLVEGMDGICPAIHWRSTRRPGR